MHKRTKTGVGNMADDVVLDFLHLEIVAYIYSVDKKDEKENCATKLEHVGFSTGYRMVERLTKEWPRFKDELDTVKFICKDFWMSIYKKQIDNLRTNHQGVYVLLDNNFRFLIKMSSEKQYLELAPRYIAFSCGLVRGALSNLGVQSVVTAEVSSMPACKFQIQVQRS